MRHRLAHALAVFTVCVIALRSNAQLGTVQPCRGAILLHVPLTSTKDEYRAKSVSGFTVTIGRFDAGWAVSVFAPNDAAESDDLLPPLGEWNGYYSVAFWVLPNGNPKAWLPNRRVQMRATRHELCLHVHSEKSVADPLLRFTGGTLVVYWVEDARPN